MIFEKLQGWMAGCIGGRRGQGSVVPYVGEATDDSTAATFRARQLQAILQLTPLTLLANSLNAAVIVATFWNAGNRIFLVAWALVTAFILGRQLRTGLRTKRQPLKLTASVRTMRRATLHAALLAVQWSFLPLVLLRHSDGPHQLVLTAVMTGMMCAGGFALATIPVAGTLYVLILGVSMAAALFHAGFALAWPMAGLLLIYAFIVVASVWSTARMFGARLAAEAEAERQSHVVGLLLRDFEENASDILWEVDAAGRLCRASAKLVELFGAPPNELGSVPFLDLLRHVASTEKASRAGLEAIQRHFHGGTPFRDLAMATTRNGRAYWWSLTAKPLLDADGRCTGWRGVATDITAAQHAKQSLIWLAHFDPLTGLANRHQFRTHLDEILSDISETQSPCAVLCLDLDHFKAVNDTLGHAVGDELLREVARRLVSLVRSTDTVARLGGDEFAIILRRVASSGEAIEMTQRLLDGIAAVCEVKGTRVVTRASIGIAMAPRDGNDIDTLLNHADLALYAAKAAGRGTSCLFTAEMAASTRRRLRIEQALRDVLERGELSLAFQPQVDLSNWQITGFEALLRWRHPELGDVSPAEFIPVAEDSGTIQAIGQWVLEQACLEAARWPDGLTVSVNVSPVQALSQDMCALARSALALSGLPATRLELEITESIFMRESDGATAALRALREIGVRIALDDFGTGFSSLAYLRRFPFDTLKIDRSFVREIASYREQRAIVKMIIGLARTLGMRTVAEGVEDASQLGILGQYNCDSIQGYLASRPMPAKDIAEFLDEWKWMGLSKVDRQDPQPTDMLPMADII